MLSVDISGPFQEGWDLDGGKPRYFLVASLTVPGGENVAEERDTGEVPMEDKQEGGADVFDERLEDYDLEGLFPDEEDEEVLPEHVVALPDNMNFPDLEELMGEDQESTEGGGVEAGQSSDPGCRA